MSEPWNLSAREWSKVLNTDGSVSSTASQLREGKMPPWFANLIAYTRNSFSIMDLGSGAGQNSAMLALHGKKTALVDWSCENIDFSKRLFRYLGLKGEFYNLDMTKTLPFGDSSFDTVFSCGVFEYVSDSQITVILREALRIARKQVIIMVPNAASIPYRLGMWYMKKTHSWQWSGERPFVTLKPYFKELGCSKIRELTVGAKHTLDFLKMPLGRLIKDRGPAFLRQGYLLISMAEKEL